MRGGEGVGLPGYDGVVEATRSSSFVPEGPSVWEMGTGRDPADKANSDFRTRTNDPLGVDTASTTFVFVTPRRWPEKKDWEKRRRDEGKWRDVRALDADDIEQALEECPAVRIWLSELLGMPTLGVATIEDWWRRFSNTVDPRLTAGIVLAGREDHAAALLRRLAVDVGRTYVKAASVDDGLAFVACTMLAQAADASEPMLSRSLLVHDGHSLRRLDSTSSLLILLPFEEALHREAQLVEHHHVVIVITDGEGHVELPPLDPAPLESALREAGVPEVDLPRFVRAGIKSLIALQRVATRFGQPDPEQWFEDLSDRAVRRAWLVGAWNQLRSGDVDVLEDVTRIPFDDLEERLLRILRQPDPLFTRVGGTWAVAAAEDSWGTAKQAFSEADLDALELAAQNVLGAVDPRLQLPPSERWTAAIYGKVRIHSNDLRKGIARSIALLGSRGDEVRLSGGRSAREWAERVVLRLLTRANDDPTAQLWASLEDVLPLLAEAAPDIVLRSIDKATSGPAPLIRKLFQDQDIGWHASSPHTGLLWALECIAWSDQHLGFASELLAKLGEIDPGGKLSNRPAASLRNIFRPPFPQTSAPAEARLMTLDALLKRHPDVAWRLLLALLDERTIGFQTYGPQFRDWNHARGQPVTYGEFFEMVDAIAKRIVDVAVQDPGRWSEVVPEFDRLPVARRREALNALSALNRDCLTYETALKAWNALADFVRRHRQYPDADWSLSEEWLGPLAEAGERLRPERASESYKWLFDDWRPDIGISVGDDFAAYEAELIRARKDAMARILNEEGFDAAKQLATEVELPWSVGAAAAIVSDQSDYEALSLMDSDDSKLVQFADGFARARTQGAVSAVQPWLRRFVGHPVIQARLLQIASDVTEAWRLASELGTDIEAAYWAEFSPYGRGSDFPYINQAARHLLDHGRAAMAIDGLSMYVNRSDNRADVDVVKDALAQLGTGDPDVRLISEYDISQLLSYLESQGVDDDEIARLEWKFLPLLGDGSKTQSLQRRLAHDPRAFVDLINLVFKPSGSEATGEVQEVDPTMATNAYRLLREWNVVPGTSKDGVVDAGLLHQWLNDVRVLLTESDRLEVGELQIGEVFAHAPSDLDGTFPTAAVRDALEQAPNERLERGFVIGLLNKQGVTTRGLADGGKQEYDLAEQYNNWAQAVEAVSPRTSGALRSVADSYRAEGRRQDEDARRYFEGLDR
ncbi:MAG: hypothetical protein K2X52_18545 [Mycobacteriaceae bacterium]|nr:hypothetical protein [Mycobacteriaceae bacterium]